MPITPATMDSILMVTLPSCPGAAGGAPLCCVSSFLASWRRTRTLTSPPLRPELEAQVRQGQEATETAGMELTPAEADTQDTLMMMEATPAIRREGDN